MRTGDTHWMRRALVLARRHAGLTWPNPTVGACIVHRGTLVAEGAHRGPGSDHGEAAALKQLAGLGLDPSELTLYVTLEPCHHRGRTPPCSQAIRAAGIGRVVYAVGDTNPVAQGGGAWLKQGGVKVESGLLADAAWELNHPFFETQGRTEAHVTLKLALSLDGRLAPARGPLAVAQRRITGGRAHRRVHQMRAASSCVLVGRETVAVDRPKLDARDVQTQSQPRPVVLDTHLSLDPAWLPAGALVFHAEALDEGSRPGPGELVGLPLDAATGRLAWPAVLEALADRGLGRVMVEGGAQVATSLLAAGHVHRFHVFLAPRLLGGDGPSLAEYAGAGLDFRRVRARRLGDDLEWILARSDLPQGPPST